MELGNRTAAGGSVVGVVVVAEYHAADRLQHVLNVQQGWIKGKGRFVATIVDMELGQGLPIDTNAVQWVVRVVIIVIIIHYYYYSDQLFHTKGGEIARCCVGNDNIIY